MFRERSWATYTPGSKTPQDSSALTLPPPIAALDRAFPCDVAYLLTSQGYRCPGGRSCSQWGPIRRHAVRSQQDRVQLGCVSDMIGYRLLVQRNTAVYRCCASCEPWTEILHRTQFDQGAHYLLPVQKRFTGRAEAQGQQPVYSKPQDLRHIVTSAAPAVENVARARTSVSRIQAPMEWFSLRYRS